MDGATLFLSTNTTTVAPFALVAVRIKHFRMTCDDAPVVRLWVLILLAATTAVSFLYVWLHLPLARVALRRRVLQLRHFFSDLAMRVRRRYAPRKRKNSNDYTNLEEGKRGGK
jgi:hypothetical protein